MQFAVEGERFLVKTLLSTCPSTSGNASVQYEVCDVFVTCAERQSLDPSGVLLPPTVLAKFSPSVEDTVGTRS